MEFGDVHRYFQIWIIGILITDIKKQQNKTKQTNKKTTLQSLQRLCYFSLPVIEDVRATLKSNTLSHYYLMFSNIL